MESEKMSEALRLADELEMWTQGEPAAAELRRLHGEVERLREVAGQALESMAKATRYMSNSDYIKLNQTIDATHAALKEVK